jgi:hypothetical protein
MLLLHKIDLEFGCMKTSIDIPESELKDAIKYAGAKSKSKRQAILHAVVEFNRRQRMAELIQYSGTSDTFMSNEEIEALDEPDPTHTIRRRKRRGSR